MCCCASGHPTAGSWPHVPLPKCGILLNASLWPANPNQSCSASYSVLSDVSCRPASNTQTHTIIIAPNYPRQTAPMLYMYYLIYSHTHLRAALTERNGDSKTPKYPEYPCSPLSLSISLLLSAITHFFLANRVAFLSQWSKPPTTQSISTCL